MELLLLLDTESHGSADVLITGAGELDQEVKHGGQIKVVGIKIDSNDQMQPSDTVSECWWPAALASASVDALASASAADCSSGTPSTLCRHIGGAKPHGTSPHGRLERG